MPFVYEVNGRFICATKYEDRHIPEDAGFRFSPVDIGARPVWWTFKKEIAYRLLEFCQDPTRDILEYHFKEWHNLPEPTISENKLQYSARYVPEDYQIKGARHILSNKYSYLWYEAGTGKTFTATMALETASIYGLTNIVVCPASLKYTWREEIDDKSHNFLDVLMINSAKDHIRANADIIIIPDSLIGQEPILKRLQELSIGVIVIDEAHRFKNDTSKRSKVLTERTGLAHTLLGKISQHLVCMSGTPMPNYKPIELWPIVNAFAPQALGFIDKFEYGRRYCESVTDEYGTSFGGADNVEELISKLKSSGYVIHQELREGDVPAQASDELIYLDPSKEPLKLKDMQKNLIEKIPLEDILKIAMGENPKLRHKVNLKAGGVDFDVSPKDFIAELRKLSGEQAADEAAKFLCEQLKVSTEPVVIFAWHKSVVTKLKVGLAKFNPLTIDGSTPMKDRQDIVNEYQNGGGQVIILNIVAGGLGYTLTKASKVYFVEFDWVVGNNDQAVRRLRRKGQKKAVTPYYFIFKDSLAHLMLSVLGKKQRNKNAVDTALKQE